MKSFILSLGLAAMVQAQGLDLDAFDAAPVAATTTPPIGAGATTVAYNSATAVASAAAEVSASPAVAKRAVKNRLPNAKRDGNCAVQPTGAGPVPDPDTPDAFLADTDFSAAATSQTTPSGFVQAFQNLDGSNSAYAYMGYTALDTYDAQTCATKCQAITGCNAFNIYFERDPTLDPGSSCPNPPSTTVIKCVFWGGPVTTENANNKGQWRSNFEVVIAGSNGYNSAGPFASPSGYTGTYLDNKAINGGSSTVPSGYMGVKTFTSGPFDPSLCSAACDAQTKYNAAHPNSDGSYDSCIFYNTYILLENGSNAKQECALYSKTWDASYATNEGQWRGTDHYTIKWSVSGTKNDASQ